MRILFILTVAVVCYISDGKEISRDALGDAAPITEAETHENPVASSCPEAAQGIEFEELNLGIQNGTFTIIDVRPKNYTTKLGIIPTSISIPFPKLKESFALNSQEFKERFEISKPETTSSNLVISCQIGILAAQAWEQVFKPMDYCNARVYYGSFEDWIEKGGDVVFL